jgi:L-threonylcarbamoyladenylate synthase
MELINNPTHHEIKIAAEALKDGHLVAFPTETVYGLGADATNEKAVRRIYSVKERPSDNPLIVHISSSELLIKWAIDIPEYALKLAEKFWPGPMTLILKRTRLAKNFITGSQEVVGIRVPAHPIATSLLAEFEKIGGNGVVAPSANKFGSVSPTSTQAVNIELGKLLEKNDLIIEGGKSKVGIESSIIDCSTENPNLIRPGAITNEMIEKIIGINVLQNRINTIKAPGLQKRHYSPNTRIRLNTNTKVGDGFLALKEIPTPIGAVRLASPSTTEEYAQTLYSVFRLADEMKLFNLVIVLPEGEGLATAIRDRVIKASSRNSLK